MLRGEDMKRPLVPAALWFAAGIILAEFAEVSLFPLFFAAVVVGGAGLGWERFRPVLLAALVGLAGAIDQSYHTAVLSPHDVRVLVGDRPALVTVRGTLAGPPSQRVVEYKGEEAWHTLAVVEASAIRLDHGPWQPAVGTLQATLKGKTLTNCFDGQALEVEGVLEPPPGPLAEGLFDYRTYLRRMGIYYELKSDREGLWHAVGAVRPPPWTERFRLWAQATLARGLPEADEALKLQWAMVLGWKTALTNEVSEPFMRSGTMHIFAISGLHIALISGILLALFRLVNLPRSVCGAVVIPLIWFYTAATEWQASAIRSTVMMTVIIAGWSLRRPSNLVNSLAAAGFAILVWDPQQLFEASFQLSFGAVLSIALMMPALERQRARLLQTDPLLPAKLRPRWQRWLLWGGNHLTQALATSLAACLGTGPLIAYYFHLFTPVSLFSNLVVVPLSGLALMSGLGGVICGSWLPWATELFNHSGWFFMGGMTWFSEWSTHWPGAYCYVAAPGGLAVALYYALLVATLGGWWAGRFRWWVAGGIGVLALVWAGAGRHDRAATRASVLPLSGGFAVWLDAPGAAGDWLFDCGNESAARRLTTPFLRGQGVNHLPRLVLTHGDVRHIGGATNLMHDFVLGELWGGPVWFRSPPYRQAVMTWTNRHRPFITTTEGDEFGAWTVLHPRGTDRFAQADDNTLVLRGTFEGTRLLLCSDLGMAGQNALIQREADVRADIVVTGLPKEGEPLHDALLDRIQPRLIIVADSDYPASEQAGLRLKGRLVRRGVPVVYTRESGAVTIEFRRGGWKLRSVKGLLINSADDREGR